MAQEIEKSCHTCGYCTQYPGSAHKQCNFNWLESELTPPLPHGHGARNGWYFFPENFDPSWQREECKAHTDTPDPAFIIAAPVRILVAFKLHPIHCSLP